MNAGLLRLGMVAGSSEPEVVVIADRHETHGSIGRSNPRWTAARKANAHAVRFLLQKGYTLLGTEAALGALPDDGPSKAHHDAWLEARREGEDVDALSLYQPLRFQWEFAPQLEVVGVEDPEIYASDCAALERINALQQAALDSVDERLAAKTAQDQLLQSIRGHAAERGRLAAQNFTSLLRRKPDRRGILLLGAAHCPAAIAELQRSGCTVLFFCADPVARLAPR